MTEVSRSGPVRVAAVVVNYHRYDLLHACLASLERSSRPPDDIVVVDNGSQEPDAKQLAERFPRVRLLRNTDNPGYAAACNQGWTSATADVIVFLNADVTLERDTLERCVDAVLDPGVGVVTPRLVRPDGTLDHACHRGIPTPTAAFWYQLRLHRLRPRSRRFARYTMSWLDPLTDHDVEACTGAFMVMRREVLERLGGWDAGYWFYGEDLDLCHRAGQAGLRIRYLGTTTETHVKGASSRLRTADRSLDPAERAAKRRIQQAIVDSHERFYHAHLAQTTPALIDRVIRLRFRLERAWYAR